MNRLVAPLLAAASLAVAAPAEAVPAYAGIIAADQCVLLATGMPYQQAVLAAIRSNYRLWHNEIAVDGHAVASRYIAYELQRQCPQLVPSFTYSQGI